jgi:hypothetical protein
MKRVHGWILENEMCTVSCYIIFKYMTNIIIFKYSSMEFLDYLYVNCIHTWRDAWYECCTRILFLYFMMCGWILQSTRPFERSSCVLPLASALSLARRRGVAVSDQGLSENGPVGCAYAVRRRNQHLHVPSSFALTLHVHALQLVHTKRWTTFSLLLIDRRPQAHQICI